MAQPSINAPDDLWDDYDRAVLNAQQEGDLPLHISGRSESIRIAMRDVIARYHPDSEYAQAIGAYVE